MSDLHGRRLVVLGASSGIGRAVASHSLGAGAEVLLCGRRRERLDDLQSGRGRGVVFPLDITEPSAIVGLREASADFGPVDAVICSVGMAQLKLLADMTQADWTQVLATNLVGVSSAIGALLPSLAPGAVVMAMSSESVAAPRWALGAYAATKAALEVSMSCWRVEHPQFRFGSIVVGSCFPTDFGRGFGGEILDQALDTWVTHGLGQKEFMDPDHLGKVITDLLAAVLPYPDIGVDNIVLRSPSPVTSSSDTIRTAALG